MTKEDLKFGNVVEVKNGERYLFIFYHGDDIFFNLKGDGYYYSSKLYFNSNDNYRIIKVYKDYTLKEVLWERKEPKEKPKLTDDEKVILRNIDKKNKWIARDKSGELWIYEEKPERYISYWDSNGELRFTLFNNLFQFIKWEDKEPYLIDDLLNE